MATPRTTTLTLAEETQRDSLSQNQARLSAEFSRCLTYYQRTGEIPPDLANKFTNVLENVSQHMTGRDVLIALCAAIHG